MLGRPIDVNVPIAQAMAVEDAVESAGDAEELVNAVAVSVFGDLDGLAMILLAEEAAGTLVRMLGVEPGTEIADSALGEIGNILVSSYIGALATMTGLDLEPRPPELLIDMLGAVLASALLNAGEDDVVLQLDSVLTVDGDHCPVQFMFVPSPQGVAEMLSRLGVK